MKLLAALCLACLFSLSAVAQDNPSTSVRLTNKDILELTQAGLSADVIVAKIKVSRCNFDTDAPILKELKQGGVSNEVIKAMVEAPYGMPKVQPTPESTPTPRMKPDSYSQPSPKIYTADSASPSDGRFPPRGAYKHKKEIVAEYDRFKDVTYVRPKYLNVSLGFVDRVSIVAVYSYPGTSPATPETITLGFYSSSKDWRFLKDREFIAIADGERLNFGEASRVDSDVSSSRYSVRVSETLAVTVPLESFLKIVNASNLQLRLGYYELQLSPDHYEALKDFASRMN